MELNRLIADYFADSNLIFNSFQQYLFNSSSKQLENSLIIAPTGIGKTLGASTLLINELVNQIDSNDKLNNKKDLPLAVWITPLKALSRNLMQQLKDTWDPFWEKHSEISSIIDRATADRTGDTSQTERKQIVKNPPFILCTTPESLFSMVVQKSTRLYLQRIRFVIVDELHSLAESKRGVLLSLTLELLERISKFDTIIRFGLSATIENVNWIAKFLVGPKREINIFRDDQFNKIPELKIKLETRKNTKLLPNTGYMGGWLSNRISKEVNMNRTILIFTKTRSASESMAYGLKQNVNDELKLRVGVHHSALSQEERFFVENGLKHGFLKAVCCTASLELGIDIGHIDEVILLSSPNSTNSAMQRIGRARHNPDEVSIGKLFVVNFFDLLVSISLKRSMMSGRLSPVTPIEKPLEILAQFIFGLAIQNPFSPKELDFILGNTLLFNSITKEELNNVMRYCVQGGASLYAYEEFKRLKLEDGKYKINSDQFKRLFYQNIGTIVEQDMVPVYSERGRKIGFLEESVATNLMINDLISISGKTYKLLGYRKGSLVVKRDTGKHPSIPRWGKVRLSLSEEVFETLKEVFKEIKEHKGLNSASDGGITSEINNNINSMYNLQIKYAPWPNPGQFQVEFYNLRSLIKRIQSIRDVKVTHPYLVVIYSFAGYKQNQTLARLIAFRLQKFKIYQVRIHADEIGFGLFSYKPFPVDIEIWLQLLTSKESEKDLEIILENSNALRFAFRETAVVGQMVLRTYYKTRKTSKQLRLSHDLLFDVLMKYEPEHPLLEAARQQVKNQFLNIPKTIKWLIEFNINKNILILTPSEGLPVLSIPIIAHGWIDWSIPDNPEEVIEDFVLKAMENI